MTDLEVRELRYFRAVALELNFSRAAERLGMAQPPLSRAIRQLERRLDVQLFERSNRFVKLTAAGQTLFEEAGHVLDAMAAATRRTQRAAESAPMLAVTAKPGIPTDLIRRIVADFRTLPRAPRVEIRVSGYGEQADMVRDGRADLALLGSPYDTRGLDLAPLTSEPRVAVLAIDHPLVTRRALTCADLATLPMPTRPGAAAAERDFWGGRDNDPALSRLPWPPAGTVVGDCALLMDVVALGQTAALIPSSLAAANQRDDIVYLPVTDASRHETALAWPEGSRDPWVAAFVRTATALVPA